MSGRSSSGRPVSKVSREVSSSGLVTGLGDAAVIALSLDFFFSSVDARER
jgi:hypothetical protein